jgi:hypothetical protein
VHLKTPTATSGAAKSPMHSKAHEPNPASRRDLDNLA